MLVLKFYVLSILIALLVIAQYLLLLLTILLVIIFDFLLDYNEEFISNHENLLDHYDIVNITNCISGWVRQMIICLNE